jgi:hypothetical protein
MEKTCEKCRYSKEAIEAGQERLFCQSPVPKAIRTPEDFWCRVPRKACCDDFQPKEGDPCPTEKP